MKSAVEAMEGINGKVLGRERVLAFYYPEDKYASKEWDYLNDYINLKNWAKPTFSRRIRL
ncbi:hypothetical protein IFM89_032326 [Coptis chinensis]|uniref:Uncharacterized protein n=1 Tax=Coptis chinensis TaxID=261450 RepID=A0A835IHR5_9MAGN|nr:hypothetical protein IFM89_032326 [Coptis chinensis]